MISLKKTIYDILKKNIRLRKFVRSSVWGLRKINYRLTTRNNRVDDKLIVFESFMGRQYSCNPRAIYEKMLQEEKMQDYKFVWAFKETEKFNEYPQLETACLVKHRSSEYFKYMSKAKVVITNSELDYRITKKEDQVFVQTWHGTPLKRLRCDIEVQNGNANNSIEEIKKRNNMDVIRYDFFLSPSYFATEKFISAFNLKELGKENIIIETGYPRNDILFNYSNEDVDRIKKKLGIPLDKKIILYAPTFRDNKHDSATGYVYDLHIDFDKMYERLGDEYVVIFRTHYFIANQFDFNKNSEFIINASDYDDISELFIISDILITDYSSVFFDYANLKRKIVYYMYDLDQYQNDIRGFYISPDILPGTIVKDEEALIDALIDNNEFYDEKYDDFNNKFNYLENGISSARVIDKIYEVIS